MKEWLVSLKGRRFAYGAAMTLLLTVAGAYPQTGATAPENQAPVGTAGRGEGRMMTPEPRGSMGLPLSTWVGPGDVIRIRAYPDTTSFISGDYTVFDSGYIMLPVLGFVQVTQMSIAGLTRQLTDTYARYMAYPSVQIEPMIRIMLLGGFLRPGSYLADPLHPLSNALASAGGPVRDDGLRLLRWERGGSVLSTNMTSEIEGSKSLWALGFKSNDQLCVTLRTRRDILPVVTFITSTIVATATLFIAFQAYSGGLSK